MEEEQRTIEDGEKSSDEKTEESKFGRCAAEWESVSDTEKWL